MSGITSLQERRTNRLLGYPDNARLLIINADDFGMCHAINEATIHALQEGVVSSTSLMTPCPWAPHAIQLLQHNQDIPFGVHLTVTCNTINYKWGPIASKDKVPSLVDEAGYFYSDERIPELLARAKLDDLEVEFRAQISAVLAANLRPTHLDWHCLADGGRADVFEMTLRLAREFGLALRVHDGQLRRKVQRKSLPVNDYEVLDSYRLDTIDKSARYAQMLHELPAGLSEWAVHPGLGNAELQAMEPDSWQVRQTDFDFLMAAKTHDLLQAEGIIRLDYRALQKIWSS